MHLRFNSKLLNTRRHVRIATRKSTLALNQTNFVVGALAEVFHHVTFEVVGISTAGDKNLHDALAKIGDKGLFTKELETALREKRVDFIVHSFKDMPTQQQLMQRHHDEQQQDQDDTRESSEQEAGEHSGDDFVVAAVLDRKRCFDAVLISKRLTTSPGVGPRSLAELPPGSTIGTSAVRRVSQLRRRHPHLRFVNVRGNLNTRLAKLDGTHTPAANGSAPISSSSGTKTNTPIQLDALILAEAGVHRMGWAHRISEVLDAPRDLYAVSQGALACQSRRDDLLMMEMLSMVHCEASGLSCIAERAMMRRLAGGCHTPIAVRCDWLTPMDVLQLRGAVFHPERSEVAIEACVRARLPLDDPAGAGGGVGDEATSDAEEAENEEDVTEAAESQMVKLCEEKEWKRMEKEKRQRQRQRRPIRLADPCSPPPSLTPLIGDAQTDKSTQTSDGDGKEGEDRDKQMDDKKSEQNNRHTSTVSFEFPPPPPHPSSSTTFSSICPFFSKSDSIVQSCPPISAQQLRAARSISAQFSGVCIRPICQFGRNRMAAAQHLGECVANQLLRGGARELLDSIPKPQPHTNTHTNTQTPLQQQQQQLQQPIITTNTTKSNEGGRRRNAESSQTTTNNLVENSNSSKKMKMQQNDDKQGGGEGGEGNDEKKDETEVETVTQHNEEREEEVDETETTEKIRAHKEDLTARKHEKEEEKESL